ncbi:MAG: chorismate-binding protein [Muribaculaceae bacterium]|nr:chorismate-binding protein [Muribaculaceae bacterium]
MITDQQLEAARYCLRMKIPFALFALPGEDAYQFIAAEDVGPVAGAYSANPASGFLICGHKKHDDVYRIAERFDEHTVMNYTPSKVAEPVHDGLLAVESDSYTSYVNGLSAVISSLKENGGKTVICRVISMKSAQGPESVAEKYFSVHPATFRYLYYTPATGTWLGASPELLLSYEAASRHSVSMALAGTLPAEHAPGWDDKNTAEHTYVLDHIVSAFRHSGLTPVVHEASEVTFGAIKHLAHKIEAHGEADVDALLDALSPTPALFGTPYENALRHITSTESCPRGCYGGWIGYRSADKLSCYVNLRCARVSDVNNYDTDYIYNVFTGSGITCDSDPESEWLETEAKASSILDAIQCK